MTVMKKTTRLTILTRSLLLAASVLVMMLVPLQAVGALDPFADVCDPKKVNTQTTLCKDRNGQQLFGAGSIWNNIINLLLVVVGIISVIMIIVGAIRYVVSNGDPSGLTGAKNTIIYAVVGLVLAVMAGAIVNFVLARL